MGAWVLVGELSWLLADAGYAFGKSQVSRAAQAHRPNDPYGPACCTKKRGCVINIYGNQPVLYMFHSHLVNSEIP